MREVVGEGCVVSERVKTVGVPPPVIETTVSLISTQGREENREGNAQNSD